MQNGAFNNQMQRGNQGIMESINRSRGQTVQMADQQTMDNCNDMINNDKNYQPVMPCIMDPGEYYLTWLLDGPTERPEDLQSTPYLSP
jgi:hypothetical protein